MKKILAFFMLIITLACTAQNTTPTYKNIKLTQVSQGTKSDSIVLYGDDKRLKFIPRSEFIGNDSGNEVLLYEGNNLINPETGDVEGDLFDWTYDNFGSKKLFYFDTANDDLWFYATKLVSGFPTYEWIKVNAAGGDFQNKFVRTLEIPANLLSGSGSTEQLICDYILALPEEDRTIADTDSKWNVVIKQEPDWEVKLCPDGYALFAISNKTISNARAGYYEGVIEAGVAYFTGIYSNYFTNFTVENLDTEEIFSTNPSGEEQALFECGYELTQPSVRYIYEIINKGKGVISEIVPADLLLITDNAVVTGGGSSQDFQAVTDEGVTTSNEFYNLLEVGDVLFKSGVIQPTGFPYKLNGAMMSTPEQEQVIGFVTGETGGFFSLYNGLVNKALQFNFPNKPNPSYPVGDGYTLTTQDDFKTINGSSIIGTGDLEIEIDDSDLLHKTGNETKTGNLTLLGDDRYVQVVSADGDGLAYLGIDELGKPYIQLGNSANEDVAVIRADNVTESKEYQLPNDSGTLALQQLRVRKISANTTLSNDDIGKIILLTASCTVTLPDGLMNGFNCSFTTVAGATLTYSLGGSIVLINNDATTMSEKRSHTIVNTGVANEYLTSGL